MNSQELIKILEEQLNQSPDDRSVKEKLANLLLNTGQHNRAEMLFNEIFKNDKNNKNCLWGLAKINWQKKDYKKAHKYLSVLAVALENKLNKDQSLLFAKIFTKLGNFKQASEWLDSAISQDSSLIQSEINLLRFLKHSLKISQALENSTKRTQNLLNQAPLINQRHYIMIEIMPQFFGLGMGNPTFIPQIFLSQAMESNQNNQDNQEAEDFEEDIEDSDTDEDFEEENNADSNHILTKPIEESQRNFLTFDQIGGLTHVKEELIKNILLPLINPELCISINKSNNPKVLLYGPEGCGKTMIAHSLANESNISFFEISSSEFSDFSNEENDYYLNNLIKVLRENKPSVLLIDNIDLLAYDGEAPISDISTYSLYNNLLNKLLRYLDKNSVINSQIGLIAITNKPWFLNSSFFVSSRINKHIFVAPPSFEEKVQILKLILTNKKSSILDVEKIDVVKVITELDNICLSGADIENLVEETLCEVLYQSLYNKQLNKPTVITTQLLIKTGKKLKGNSLVKFWLEKAKRELKGSSLEFLWNNINKSNIKKI